MYSFVAALRLPAAARAGQAVSASSAATGCGRRGEPRCAC